MSNNSLVGHDVENIPARTRCFRRGSSNGLPRIATLPKRIWPFSRSIQFLSGPLASSRKIEWLEQESGPMVPYLSLNYSTQHNHQQVVMTTNSNSPAGVDILSAGRLPAVYQATCNVSMYELDATDAIARIDNGSWTGGGISETSEML